MIDNADLYRCESEITQPNKITLDLLHLRSQAAYHFHRWSCMNLSEDLQLWFRNATWCGPMMKPRGPA